MDNRRKRIFDALAAGCARKGYADTKTEDIVRGATISRRTLYEEFANKADVAVAMLEWAHGELFEAVERACNGREGPTAIEAGLGALLEWFAKESLIARACLVERLGSEEADHLQAAAGDRFVAMLRARVPADPPRPQSIDKMVVGGVESMVRRVLMAGRGPSAPSLLPDLIAFVLRSYDVGWSTG